MTERYDFSNDKFTKMLRFFGSRGLRPDLPSPFGRKFQFCFTCIVPHVVDIDFGNLSLIVFCNLLLHGDSRF